MLILCSADESTKPRSLNERLSDARYLLVTTMSAAAARQAISARLPPDLVSATILTHAPGRVFLRKPAGLPVLPLRDDPKPTLLDAYSVALKRLAGKARFADGVLNAEWPAGFELGIAHRLDTATGGVVVAATSPDALSSLRSEFSEKEVRKFYLFRSLAPRPAWRDGKKVITLPLAHHASDKKRMVLGRPPTAEPTIQSKEKDIPHKGKWHPAYTVFRAIQPTDPLLVSLVPGLASNRLLADPILLQSIQEKQHREAELRRRLAEKLPPSKLKPVNFARKAYEAGELDFNELSGYYTAEIRTGVTHQIRLHALAAGIPIAGDPLYDPETRRVKKEGGEPEEFLLHCWKIQGNDWESPMLPYTGEAFDAVEWAKWDVARGA